MKIIYTIAATYNSGGMERVLANKANWLANKGYDVVIVTTDQQNRPPFFDLHPSIQQIDLGVNYLHTKDTNILQKIYFYLKKQKLHKQKLIQVLLQQKADIVVSMFDSDATLLYKIKDGSRKILEIHFSRFKRLQYGRRGVWQLLDKIRSWQDKYIAKRYDRFVVLTHEDKQYWGNMPYIRVIPNANSFFPANPSLLRNPRAIAVGRLEYQKHFQDLIRVWHHMREERGDTLWPLHIYGDGMEFGSLRSLIERYQLQDKVFLHLSTKDIQREYLDSSIFVMTSRYEGLPMSMLEAQACGLPLVSYACKCGPRDIIKPGVNGYLIGEGDVKTFAHRVSELMDSPFLLQEMGQHSREMALQYEPDEIMKKWEMLFQEVLE